MYKGYLAIYPEEPHSWTYLDRVCEKKVLLDWNEKCWQFMERIDRGTIVEGTSRNAAATSSRRNRDIVAADCPLRALGLWWTFREFKIGSSWNFDVARIILLNIKYY